MKCKSIKSGNYLWKKGDHADGIYFIITGKVYLMIENPFFKPFMDPS